MNYLTSFYIFLFSLFPVFEEESIKPLFFDLILSEEPLLRKSVVGEVMEEGFIEPISLQLVKGAENPLFYESTIRTAVCDDEICEIMYVKLYWDLVGEYVGYDTLPGHQLTKFDHEPFTTQDYHKLHELLKNDGSILKFKVKDELIDKEKLKASDVVDGTTGATALEIKEEVVEGALYSSYTLWHLAYSGTIQNMLTNHTVQFVDNELKYYLLNSNRAGYRLFAFQNFREGDFKLYENFWLKSLREDIPMTRKFILANLPDPLWSTVSVQDKVCGLFQFFDVNTKTYLLKKMEALNEISAVSLEYISVAIMDMNKNQVKQFLELAKRNEVTDETLRNISNARSDDGFKYGYIIDEYDLIN